MSANTDETCSAKKILECTWVNSEDEKIDTSAPNKNVKIKLRTSGFIESAGDGESAEVVKIMVNIFEYTTVVKKGNEVEEETLLDITKEVAIGENGVGFSEEFTVDTNWMLKELGLKILTDSFGTDVPDEDIKGNRLLVMMDYTPITIELRDVRSGVLISNAKVKNIRVSEVNAQGERQSDIMEIKKTATEQGFSRTDKVLPARSTSRKIEALSIEALKRILGKIDDIAATYNDTWKGYYREYWASRCPGGNIQYPTNGRPSDAGLELIKREYNSCLQTTAGIVTVWIPSRLLDNKRVAIEIGFWDSPVIKERLNNNATLPVRTTTTDDQGIVTVTEGATNFSVRWNQDSETTGTQSVNWGEGFNWYVQQADGETVNAYELKVSESLLIKGDAAEFTALNDQLFSQFFPQNTPHFVLFAMQWCQPVWDGIEDSGDAGTTMLNNDADMPTVYIQDDNLRNLKMHIVSMYTGSQSYGKEYGTYRHRYKNSSVLEAVDIYTVDGETEEFAIHAGKIGLTHNSATAGNYAVVSWGVRRLRYLHLASFDVVNDDYLMCGTKIGTAGRTGNLTDLYPTHVHLDDGYGTHDSGILTYRGEVDEHNRICIPDYNYPLLFPCACAVELNGYDPSLCEFSTSMFATECWAVRELRCPKMLGNNTRLFRIQAQLRYLNFYTSTIDGVFGGVPQNAAVRISNTRLAIYRFKEANNLLIALPNSDFNPNNYDLSLDDNTELDRLATINVREIE